jgi:lipopolysaccharide export system permease protein
LIKKLDAYVLRELTVPFLIGTIAVTLMFVVNLLMGILEQISLQNVPREAILLGLLYRLPYFLNMTLPIGVSLAGSLAFTRLTRESELTALRAAGTPILRVVLPVAVFGLCVGVFNFYLVEKIMPKAELKFTDIERKVGMLGVMPKFKQNAVIYLKDYTASFGMVNRVGGDSLQLEQVVLIQRPRSDETDIYTADSGVYKDGVWTLHRPYGWMLKGLDLVGVHPQKDDMVIDQKIIIDDFFNPPTKETETTAELRAAIANARKVGNDTQELEVEFHTRFSVPASCILFACIAPIFAILFGRTGGFAGVLVSLFLVMLYYNMFMVSTEILGKSTGFPPALAAWLPNILLGAVGLYGLRRLE